MLNWHKTAVVSVILVAIFLRFYNLESTQKFLLDEARDAWVMQKMINQGYMPLIGPTTSIGQIPLGPFYYYLMVPWLWVFRLHPIGLSYATAVMGLVTVGLVYRFGKEILGQQAALIAMYLYAVNPWVVNATRQAWNPHPLPLFAVLVWWLLWRAHQKPYLYIGLAGLLSGLALQLHYAAVFLGFATLFVVGFGWISSGYQKKWIMAGALGLLAGLLTLSPWIYYQYLHAFAVMGAIIQSLYTLPSSTFQPHYTLIGWPLAVWFIGKMITSAVASTRIKWQTVIIGIGIYTVWLIPEYNFFSPQVVRLNDYQQAAAIIDQDGGMSRFNLIFLDPSQEYMGLNWRYFVALYNNQLIEGADYRDLDSLYVLTSIKWNVTNHAWVVEKYLQAQHIHANIPQTMVKNWKVNPQMWIYKLSSD